MQTMRPVGRPSVVEVIVDQIKSSLLDGALKPGQKLQPEQELADQLMVGRSSVREAVKMLAALGVVEVRQGDGTYIAEGNSPALLDPLVFALLIQAGTSEEVLELRQMIELGCCELAALRATDEDLARLEESMRTWQQGALSANPDLDRLAELDLQFHCAFIDMTRNPLIIRIASNVESMFFASIRRAYRTGGFDGVMQEHPKLIAALRTRDPMQVRAAVNSSLQTWYKHLTQTTD